MKDHPNDDDALLVEGPSTDVGPWIPIRDVANLGIQAVFDYGSGGESVVARIQTTFDGGKTAIDIAAFGFAKKSDTQFATISANVPPPADFVPQDRGLPPGSAVNGILGNRVRRVIESKGVYADNTTLKLYVAPR